MRKIEYNVSSGKSIDRKYFFITISLILLFSILSFYIGFSRVTITNHNLKEKVDKKNYYNDEQRKIDGKEKLFGERIEKIKVKWNSRVNFANTVIKVKIFPFIKYLEYFEEILPAMVQINDIFLDSGMKGEVILSVSSYSTDKLYELYRKLIGHNLVIVSENENSGVYRSKLKVTLKK